MTNAKWTITDTQKPTRESADQLGNKFLLGNGFVGVRGTLDEYGQAEKVACIPTGIYDQFPGKWREPINLPNPLFFQVSVGGKALHAIDTATESHDQTLDFRRGVSSRKTVFLPDARDPNTCLTVQSERFVSMKHANLLSSRVTITSTKDLEIEVIAGVDGDIWDINGPHLDAYRVEFAEDADALFSETLEKKIPVVSASLIMNGVGGVLVAEQKVDTQAYKKGSYTLKAGEPRTFHIFGYVGYGAAQPKSLTEVRQRLAPLVQQGYAGLLAEHEKIWSELWHASDVTIEGDDDAQYAPSNAPFGSRS
jgi:trehalose/maltose hydrolase-like predicted phosphorylase